MKRVSVFLLIVLIIIGGCEIFTIGKPEKMKSNMPDLTRDTPVGAVMLFKSELDSNNIPAATQILADSTGERLLAFEQYNLYDEVARIGRMIGRKKINSVQKDSLSPILYRVSLFMEEDVMMNFTTTKVGDMWYIVRYE